MSPEHGPVGSMLQERASAAHLTLDELRALAIAGEIEVVAVVVPDHLGRAVGKRYTVAGFLDEVIGHGALVCGYVFERDINNNPLPDSWGTGFFDHTVVPDLSTLRRAAWLDKTAIVICDMQTQDDRLPVAISPREVLKGQLARLGERGLWAASASELEFILFRNSYREAHERDYRDLRPSTHFNEDFAILGATWVEDFLGPLRRAIPGSGLMMVDSKTESNLGQIEINFLYEDALKMADDHVIYKELTKALAGTMGHAATFMPKYNEREGNSCHIHMSLWEGDSPAFVDPDGGRSAVFESFLAGLIKYIREMTYFFAPNINSYKRLQPRTFAPTALCWGEDNRTTLFRVLGRGPSLRVETRLGGGDCNPYLAFATLVAMGLRGIEEGLELEPALVGDAYAREDLPSVPSSLRQAVELLDASEFARESFGKEVIDHYVALGRYEADEFDAAVTNWELRRSFERL